MACGPTGWEDGDESCVVLSAVVTDANGVIASGGPSERLYAPNDDELEFTAKVRGAEQVSGRLSDGDATSAEGVALVTKMSGQTQRIVWRHPPEDPKPIQLGP
jgi:hypothetical protein